MTSGRVFRVTATMPGPVEKVAALIRDVNGHGTWNRTLQVDKQSSYLTCASMIKFRLCNFQHYDVKIISFKSEAKFTDSLKI